jgi:dCMP deaminase
MSTKWDEFFMRQVYLISSMSKDASTKIGAVLVRGRQVISQGFNGIPMGVNDKAWTDAERARHERPEKYMWYEHGERNAIFCCARHGISSEGATLYTQGMPCADCGRAIIQAGVSEVVLHTAWSSAADFKGWDESRAVTERMFQEAKIKVRYCRTLLDIETVISGQVVKV